jgi:hypothetical protein
VAASAFKCSLNRAARRCNWAALTAGAAAPNWPPPRRCPKRPATPPLPRIFPPPLAFLAGMGLRGPLEVDDEDEELLERRRRGLPEDERRLRRRTRCVGSGSWLQLWDNSALLPCLALFVSICLRKTSIRSRSSLLSHIE